LQISVSFHHLVDKEDGTKVIGIISKLGSENFEEITFRMVDLNNEKLPHSNISFYVFNTAGRSREGEFKSFPSMNQLKQELNSSNVVVFLTEYDSSDSATVIGSGITLENTFNEILITIKMKIIGQGIKNEDQVKSKLEDLLLRIRNMHKKF